MIKSDVHSEKRTENADAGGQNINESGSKRKIKILLIDSEPDRQARIAILKARGFTVYPALSLEQARSRCRPGAYDLIVVNSSSNRDMAVEFCEQIGQKDPKQQVLMIVREPTAGTDGRMVSSDPEQLAARVQSLLQAEASKSRQRVA